MRRYGGARGDCGVEEHPFSRQITPPALHRIDLRRGRLQRPRSTFFLPVRLLAGFGLTPGRALRLFLTRKASTIWRPGDPAG